MMRICLFSRTTRTLILLLYTVTGLALASGQEFDSNEISRLTAFIDAFEKTYYGNEVHFGGRDNVRLWYAADGQACVVQLNYNYDNAPNKGILDWRLHHWNSRYLVSVYKQNRDDPFYCLAIDSDFPGAFSYPCMTLIGKDCLNYRGFADLVTDSSASLSLKQLEIDGRAYQALVVELPEYSDYKFIFDGDLLAYIVSTTSRGDLVGDLNAGKYVKWQAQDNVMSWKYTYGPITYSKDGKPIEIEKLNFELVFDNKPTETSLFPGYRVLESNVYKPGVSEERIDIQKFGIPKRLEARVNSGVPYELHDGRLVKLSDLRAEEVIKESAFRPPSFWSKWQYPILLGCFLLFLCVFFWVRR